MPILFLVFLSATAPAMADSRYSCMAGDKQLKLAMHLEFSEELGGRLAHFSGAMSVLAPDAPPALAIVRLDSTMLMQRWVDQESIMLRLFDDRDDEQPVSIALGARVSDAKAGRFRGSYILNRHNGKEPGLRLEGALYCQIDRLADFNLEDPL